VIGGRLAGVGGARRIRHVHEARDETNGSKATDSDMPLLMHLLLLLLLGCYPFNMSLIAHVVRV